MEEGVEEGTKCWAIDQDVAGEAPNPQRSSGCKHPRLAAMKPTRSGPDKGSQRP